MTALANTKRDPAKMLTRGVVIISTHQDRITHKNIITNQGAQTDHTVVDFGFAYPAAIRDLVRSELERKGLQELFS